MFGDTFQTRKRKALVFAIISIISGVVGIVTSSIVIREFVNFFGNYSGFCASLFVSVLFALTAIFFGAWACQKRNPMGAAGILLGILVLILNVVSLIPKPIL